MKATLTIIKNSRRISFSITSPDSTYSLVWVQRYRSRCKLYLGFFTRASLEEIEKPLLGRLFYFFCSASGRGRILKDCDLHDSRTRHVNREPSPARVSGRVIYCEKQGEMNASAHSFLPSADAGNFAVCGTSLQAERTTLW